MFTNYSDSLEMKGRLERLPRESRRFLPALRNSASTLPWRQIFSHPAQVATGNNLSSQDYRHVETEHL